MNRYFKRSVTADNILKYKILQINITITFRHFSFSATTGEARLFRRMTGAMSNRYSHGLHVDSHLDVNLIVFSQTEDTHKCVK